MSISRTHASRMAPTGISRRSLLKATPAALAAAGLVHPAFQRLASAGVWFATDQDTLVIADDLVAHWRTLDPAWFYEGNPSSTMYLLYDQLYHIPDGEKPTDVLPLLASDMPEVSEDGLTVTIPLREGITFHTTGNPFTADDVIFSFNRLKHVGAQASFLATDYWDTIEALDDYTIQMQLPTPNGELPSVLTAVMLSITDKAAVEAAGGTDAEPSSDDENAPELLANTEARAILDQNSAGTGPFMISSFDINGEVRIEANPDYWGDAPQIEQVIWRNTTDLNGQLQSLQIGEVDIATSINADEISSIEENDDFQVVQGETLAIQYLAFNFREDWGGPVTIKEVRQALAYAIDYDGIIESLLQGRALRPATTVPLPLAGTEDVLEERYVLDLAQAQVLWDQSGVGEATIEIMYGVDSTGRGGVDLNTLIAKMQSDLNMIQGLTVELLPLPNAQRRESHRNGEFQITLGSWIPDFPGADSYATPFFRTDASGAKRIGYSDPEMDAMLDAAVAEQDAETRDDLYADIQRKAIDEVPYILLYQPSDIKIAARGVENVQVHPAYSLQLRQASKSE